MNYFDSLCYFQQATGTFQRTAAKAVYSFMTLHQLSPLALLDPYTLQWLCSQQQPTSSQPEHKVLGITITWQCTLVAICIQEGHPWEAASSSATVYGTWQFITVLTTATPEPDQFISTPLCCFLQIHCNVPISARRSLKWSPSCKFPHQISVPISVLMSTCHSPPAALSGLQGPLCLYHSRVCVCWHNYNGIIHPRNNDTTQFFVCSYVLPCASVSWIIHKRDRSKKNILWSVLAAWCRNELMVQSEGSVSYRAV